jgi:nicotinamidase-related amidase
MCSDKINQVVWELSNSDSPENAGIIHTKGTGLLVIDFQNFNMNKKGFLGHLFEDKSNVIPKTKAIVEKAREHKIPIIYINTILNPALMPDTQLFTKLKKSIPWDKLTPKELAWNMGVIDELCPHKDDYIVEKGSWSNGFRETNLREIVRKLEINSLVFTGVAEPIAIYGTFLGAWDEGLETVMIADCIMASAIDQEVQNTIHAFSINTFYPMMGARVTDSRYLIFD